MATRRKAGRIFWRKQGRDGKRRAYGDFRDFADVGGRQEALVADATRGATDDPVIAEALVARRLAELQELRRNRVLLGIERETTLAAFAAHHVAEKKRAARVTVNWAAETEKKLGLAVEFFGADRDLGTIAVSDIHRWEVWLAAKRRGRYGRKVISGGTVRHYLNALSNLYRRAASEGYVRPGFNPVAALLEKPMASREEARWLEVPDAALLLESARTYRSQREHLAIPFIYPLLATFLLTGGREMEVLGLEVGDVSLTRGTVTFRPNEWRRLKTRTSHRTVPLWPQLRDVLTAYLSGADAPGGRLLFPATRVEAEQPVWDFRKTIDAVALQAGWNKGDIRTKAFRHTYCAARLQTLDRGHPVSPWTVAREMGHGGTSLVERVYGHLGDARHRSDVVEYRLEQHQQALRTRLDGLQSKAGRLHDLFQPASRPLADLAPTAGA